MEPENLFDRLPGELVSRVFTAGCDMHDPRDTARRPSPVELQSQEYEFNAAMRRTCKRFYHISREPGNRHLWFRNINFDLNLQWGDMSVEFTQYCHELISAQSRGCDIHVSIMTARIPMGSACDLRTRLSEPCNASSTSSLPSRSYSHFRRTLHFGFYGLLQLFTHAPVLGM